MLFVCSQQASAADQLLLLDVQINGQAIGKVGEFTLRDGTLLALRSELRDLGVQDPLSPKAKPDDLIGLSTLPGLTWHVDQRTMTLYLTATDERRRTTVLQVDDKPAASGAIESGTGAMLNYDVVTTLVGRQVKGNASLDLTAFSPRGVASSGFLVHTGRNSNSSGDKTLVRLDSTYTFANPANMRRYSLGDFITGGLSWTRPVHLSGFQVRSDFSMRPDLLTFPLPSVSGSAAVPSTVEILTNGNAVTQQQVDPGPFQVPQLPVVTGAGSISMTVTNALGQQTTVSEPFYASSALLAPGLQAFSVQAGAVRQNWGSVSNEYGTFAATATYRRGLSSTMTVEASTEATPSAFMAGGGAVVNVHNLGVMSVDIAGSDGSAHTGALLSIGGERIGRRFSMGGTAALATGNFRDLAAMNSDPHPRQQVSGNVGLTLGRLGSLGIAYAGVDQIRTPDQAIRFGSVPQHSQILSASYSVQVNRVLLSASEFHEFSQSVNGGVAVALTIPFGRRSSVTVSQGSDAADSSIQAQRPATRTGDWGYQAYVSGGGFAHQFADFQYKSPWGLLSAGVDHSGEQTSVVMESQGALSFVDGALFPSNTISDSFAVVDTSGLEHVHVFEENREIGSTNSKGRLLIPDLRSFDVNHLTIEPTDVPLDSTLSVVARQVRPQDRSGVVVKFPVKVSHAALLRLADDKTGEPIPVGSTATFRNTGVIVPVGYDGEAYIEDLSLHNDIAVERPNGQRCEVIFDYRPVQGEIPTIGPLACQDEQ